MKQVMKIIILLKNILYFFVNTVAINFGDFLSLMHLLNSFHLKTPGNCETCVCWSNNDCKRSMPDLPPPIKIKIFNLDFFYYLFAQIIDGFSKIIFY